MIDHYFDADIEFFNHALEKSFSLSQIKTGAKEAYKKYKNLQSELKELILEGNPIAFRVQQLAIYEPDGEQIKLEVMNMYTCVDGKVKPWRLWDHGYIPSNSCEK
jgi:hypothetical protein